MLRRLIFSQTGSGLSRPGVTLVGVACFVLPSFRSTVSSRRICSVARRLVSPVHAAAIAVGLKLGEIVASNDPCERPQAVPAQRFLLTRQSCSGPPSSGRCATSPNATATSSPVNTLTRPRADASPTGPSSNRCSTKPEPRTHRSRKSSCGSSPASPASASTPPRSSRCCADAGSASPRSPSTPTTRRPTSRPTS